MFKNIKSNKSDAIGETKIKLIRSESVGKYSWDTKGSYGENDWSTSELRKLLNEEDYFNRTGSLSEKGLTSEAKNMISEVLWNIKATNITLSTAKGFYDSERGTTT